MSILTRQLTAAAVAAVAGCAGAAPAFAGSNSSATAIKAKTPLVAAIVAQTNQIKLGYVISHKGDVNPFHIFSDNRSVSASAAEAVARVHAGAAQLPAKREWILGVDMQIRGDNAIDYGEHEIVYKHPTTGDRMLSAGLADYRLSNYYIGQADSLLGIPHPARTAEPYQPYRDMPVPPGPGTLRTPTGLVATIAMGTPALHEDLPRDIETAFVDPNEAAASYYSVAISRMHGDRAQRPAQLEWVKGVQTQLRGDELLARGQETHRIGNPTTGNNEMKDALGVLRKANSEIGDADASLGVPSSGPSATLPSHVIYYKG